ncbi:hypothetical protein GCM10025864_35210 [Luteimicrobium album]|uniref:Uncharacterized protein n=1 Tax=Luteimicrobium album TaxID=1054550 RepID=A0ABQ6I5L8_9MICO|nr:hypothetical protein GCM10025864_35210 [Luteimicrobium album]
MVVDVREPAQVPVGQPLHGGEEPEVDGALRLADVEALEGVGVGGPDGAHVRGRPVPQDDVGLPLLGIGRGGGLAHTGSLERVGRARRGATP